MGLLRLLCGSVVVSGVEGAVMWAWQEVKSGVKQLFFHFCENNSLFSAVITKNMCNFAR